MTMNLILFILAMIAMFVVAAFALFQKAFDKRKGSKLPVTAADALLAWLKVYPFADLKKLTDAELLKTLDAIWSDIELLAEPEPISVSTEAQELAAEDGLFGRLRKTMFPPRLNVAFISNLDPEESDWSRAHDLGRQYLEAVMGDRVTIQTFHSATLESGADEAMEEAVANGAQVIFASTPTLIGACRRAAAKHPNVRILNCSAAMPYAGIRTYYSRIYEGKFITGAIAGAISRTGKIGYVASNPIFGVPAGINAFALGAQMTNPEAKILLRWSCVEEDAMERLASDGAELISNRDLPTPDRIREPWGLCQALDNKDFRCIASPYWHWGNFYVKLVKSIMSGGWDALSSADPHAVNYWWGMSSGVIDVFRCDTIPYSTNKLVKAIQKTITADLCNPFDGELRSQNGLIKPSGSPRLSNEEIINMNWLNDNVIGSIPGFDELTEKAQQTVRANGMPIVTRGEITE